MLRTYSNSLQKRNVLKAQCKLDSITSQCCTNIRSIDSKTVLNIYRYICLVRVCTPSVRLDQIGSTFLDIPSVPRLDYWPVNNKISNNNLLKMHEMHKKKCVNPQNFLFQNYI